MGKQYFFYEDRRHKHGYDDKFILTDTYKFKNINFCKENIKDIESVKDKVICKTFNNKKYIVPVDIGSEETLNTKNHHYNSLETIRAEEMSGLLLNYDNEESLYRNYYEKDFRDKLQQKSIVDVFYKKYFLDNTEDEDDFYSDDLDKVIKHNLSGDIIITNSLEHVERICIVIDDTNTKIRKVQLDDFRGEVVIKTSTLKPFLLDTIICPKAKLTFKDERFSEDITYKEKIYNEISCVTFNLYEMEDKLRIKHLILNEPKDYYSEFNIKTDEPVIIDNLEINTTKPIYPNFSWDFKPKQFLNITGDSNLILAREFHKKKINWFKDKNFVITGRLECFERSWITDRLIDLGAKVYTSVKPEVNYLICDDFGSTSTKTREAIKMGIKVIDSKSIKMFLDLADKSKVY